MAHTETNEEVVTGWTDEEVVQYVKFLNRQGELGTIIDDDRMATICDIFEDKEIDGKALWDMKKGKELRIVVGDEFSKECRKIFLHLRQLKNNGEELQAPCKYQLYYKKIADWESERLQKWIASIDENGKYYKYFDNFKDVTGDILLHKIENTSAVILGDYGIDENDRRDIWRKINRIKQNKNTPDQRSVFRDYELVKHRLNQKEVINEEKSKDIKPYSNDKHPKEWSKEEVAEWICSLEGGSYQRYKQDLIDNEFDGEELTFTQLNENDFKDYIKKKTHRRGIMQAIQQLLGKYGGDELDYDHDDIKEDILAPSDAKSQIRIDNLLVIIIPIGKYAAQKDDLPDVACDAANYRDILAYKYKYKWMSSVDMQKNTGYKMSKHDVKTYIDKECIPALVEGTGIDRKPRYDGFLVAFSAHGAHDSIICSDNEMIKYSQIREWFESDKVLEQIPRFFCVDACRPRLKDPKQEIEDMKFSEDNLAPLRAVGGIEAPSTTIVATKEGQCVRGGKVSKYLCEEWNKDFDANSFKETAKLKYKRFGLIYDAAYKRVKDDTKNDKIPHCLKCAEYDRAIDDVVFVPKTRVRVIGDADGDAQIIDDELRNILLPQADSNKNLMKYYFKLFDANVRDNAALFQLTRERLVELEIRPIFDQNELLRRIDKVRQNNM